MKYIQVNEDTWIEFDETNNTSKVLIKSDLEKELKRAQERLKEIPLPPTDAELLEWAKANYPQMDYSAEKDSLEQLVADHSAILENLK